MTKSLLSQPVLMDLLGETDPKKVLVMQQVTSTNLLLKQYAQEGAPEGTLLLAAAQSAGRGRLGRSFYSPDETGMYLSVLFRPKINADDAVLLTAAAACAVQEAIFEVCGIDTGIKWVNDLYLDGKKVCGILAEAAFDSDGCMRYAVVGIGINIQTPKDGFPQELKSIVTSLYGDSDAPQWTREKLAAAIVRRLRMYYQDLPTKKFMQRYREKNFIPGMRVRLSSNGHTALAMGIDDDAGLIVRDEQDNCEYTLTFGEVSVLPI